MDIIKSWDDEFKPNKIRNCMVMLLINQIILFILIFII